MKLLIVQQGARQSTCETFGPKNSCLTTEKSSFIFTIAQVELYDYALVYVELILMRLLSIHGTKVFVQLYLRVKGRARVQF